MLLHDPLLPVYIVFNSVLGRVSLERKKANNCIAALAPMVDAAAGDKRDCLPDPKFMIQHADEI